MVTSFPVHPASISLGVLVLTLFPAAAFAAQGTPHRGSRAAPVHHAPLVMRASTTARAAAAKPVQTHSISSGSPTNGHLLNGAHLMPSSTLRISPSHTGGDIRWGLTSLVSMLERAGAAVAKHHEGSVLTVGNLSRQGGGEVDHHASHESGRDADVAFYVKNASGRQSLADGFVPFRGTGDAPTWPGATFDDAKNWAFVAALLSDPEARVSHIFVATPLRERLLAYAHRIGAHPDLRERASEVLAQPRGSLPHDDHFHVRISCPHGMQECVETPLPRSHGGAVARAGASVARARTASRVAKTHHVATAGQAAVQPVGTATRPPRPAEPKSGDDDVLGKLIGPKVEGLDSVVIPARVRGAILSDMPTVEPIDDVDGPVELEALPAPDTTSGH